MSTVAPSRDTDFLDVLSSKEQTEITSLIRGRHLEAS
jgi:hypothetical protein